MLLKQNPAVCYVRGDPVVSCLGAGDANFAGTEPRKVHQIDDMWGIRVSGFYAAEARCNTALEVADRNPAFGPTM
jgi:hypothetical protein